MDKRWKVAQPDPGAVALLRDSLHIHRALCALLVERGVSTYDDAKRFFRPSLADLHSPWSMKGMRMAVDRVMQAILKEEKVLLYGDYDVDGTTSVACLYRFLKPHLSSVDFYIPNRYREGYGVSKQGVEFAREGGYSLVIALDCGIKSVELIRWALEHGIDFVVCDHHLPDEELPPAVAILNPKQKGCPYPFKELCGCGVTFKLISALRESLALPPGSTETYLDLVATAIAADIVPMTGENRILAHFGIRKVNEDPCPGIAAIIQLSGLQKAIRTNSLVFVIAPRVNAAGRMDDARKAVRLFIEEDPAQALLYAEMLHNDNSDRKDADMNITQEALALIESDPSLAGRRSTVVFQPHWHKGVVGIVASRLIERYYRPTIVLTRSGDEVVGSARSVNGFNIYEAVHRCRGLLVGYGGHFYAAGLTLLPENIGPFTELFESVVSESIRPDSLVPELPIDAELQLADLQPSFFNILRQMEPYGPGNMRPLFLSRGVADYGHSKIVKEEHVRFVVRQGSTSMTGIGFNMAAKFPLIQPGKPLDIVYTLDENEWNGEKTLQLKVVDVRASDPPAGA